MTFQVHGGNSTVPHVRYCPGCLQGRPDHGDCPCGYDAKQRAAQEASNYHQFSVHSYPLDEGPQDKRERFLLELAKAHIRSGGGMDTQDAKMLKRYVDELLREDESR